MNTNVEDLIDGTMNKIKTLTDVDTVIGSKIIINENITLIPISKVSYAFGAGGSDFPDRKQEKESSNHVFFGGGGGSGVSIVPVGFLVINKDDIKFLQVESYSGAFDRAVSMAPEVLNKIKSLFKNSKKKTEDKLDSTDIPVNKKTSD